MNTVEDKEKAMETDASEDWASITAERIEELIAGNPDPAAGYMIWTRESGGDRAVRENLDACAARGIRHVRTGVAWAEWYHEEKRPWIESYIRAYANKLTVLPCFSFTPPEIGLQEKEGEWLVNVPPKDTGAFANFVDDVLRVMGDCFEEVELWNEWNLNTDWNPKLDPNYERFTDMILLASEVARRHKKRIVFGGMSKVNEETLRWMREFKDRGLADAVDMVGIHNLRGTWSDDVPSPPFAEQVRLVREAWGNEGLPVMLTEYGFPPVSEGGSWDSKWLEDVQVAVFAYAVYSALVGSIERFYWYTYKDEVHRSLRHATTGWEDKLQWYFGDTTEDGRPRRLARLLCEGGPLHVLRTAVGENLMPLVDAASLGREMPKE